LVSVDLALDVIAARRRPNSLLVVIHVSDGVSGVSDTYAKVGNLYIAVTML